MITMDVEGITWVGHIYQKFEAMCLEVEEVVYQDTVKYVENQVQNVGESVKNFYSDVMLDLLPPSSVDAMKVPASDFSIEQYSDVGIYKKPKVGRRKNHVRVDVGPLTENSKVIPHMNKDLGRARSLHKVHDVDNLFLPSSGDSVKGTCSKLCSGQYNNGSIYNNSNMGVKKDIGNDKLPPTEMSEAIVAVNDLGGASSFRSSDNIAKISAPALVEVRGFDSISESSNVHENASEHVSDVSIASASSDMTGLARSVGNEGTGSRLPNSDGFLAESNAVDICTYNGVVSLVGSSLDFEVRHNDFAEKEVVSHPERSDDRGLDGIESGTPSEQGVETSKKFANLKLEETCVLVDGDELHFVPHKEGKRRPYKNKIREAFSSRMRSARKQEYEQLAVWYGYDGKSNQASAESSMLTLPVVDREKSETNDFCETEWELL